MAINKKGQTLVNLLEWRSRNSSSVETLNDEEFGLYKRITALWQRRTSSEHHNKVVTLREHAKECSISERTAWQDWTDTDTWVAEESKDSRLAQRERLLAILDRSMYNAQIKDDTKLVLEIAKEIRTLYALDKLDDEKPDYNKEKLQNTIVAVITAPISQALKDVDFQSGVIDVMKIKEKIGEYKFDSAQNFADFEEVEGGEDE